MKNITVTFIVIFLSLFFSVEAHAIHPKKGEGFWQIAQRCNVDWQELVKINKVKLVDSDNPNLIFTWQDFNLPEVKSEKVKTGKIISQSQSKEVFQGAKEVAKEKKKNIESFQRKTAETDSNKREKIFRNWEEVDYTDLIINPVWDQEIKPGYYVLAKADPDWEPNDQGLSRKFSKYSEESIRPRIGLKKLLMAFLYVAFNVCLIATFFITRRNPDAIKDLLWKLIKPDDRKPRKMEHLTLVTEMSKGSELEKCQKKNLQREESDLRRMTLKKDRREDLVVAFSEDDRTFVCLSKNNWYSTRAVNGVARFLVNVHNVSDVSSLSLGVPDKYQGKLIPLDFLQIEDLKTCIKLNRFL